MPGRGPLHKLRKTLGIASLASPPVVKVTGADESTIRFVTVPLPVDGGETFQWTVDGTERTFTAPDGMVKGQEHEFQFDLKANGHASPPPGLSTPEAAPAPPSTTSPTAASQPPAADAPKQEPAASPDPPSPTPPATTESDAGVEEQMYELEVPPNTRAGSKLKLTIPGMTEKVVITVPEGAEPGRTISFTLPKGKPAVDAYVLEQTKAATAIQAVLRGKAARRAGSTTTDTQTPRAPPALPSRAPSTSTPAKSTSSASVGATSQGTPTIGFVTPPNVSKSAAVAMEDDEPPPSRPGVLTSFRRSVTSALISVLAGPAEEPPTDPATALSAEVAGVVAAAIRAWEAADFDAFASLAAPSISVSLPGTSATGMTGVWEAREADEVDGVLSIDTLMLQLDAEDGSTATVVGVEHSHDTTEHGMPVRHSWLKVSLARDAGQGAWKLVELIRDPIWPPPTERATAGV